MINEPMILTKNSLKAINFKKNPIHNWTKKRNKISKIKLPEILIISSYPPRECGIATYTQDLIKALKNKYKHSFTISICPLESTFEQHIYTHKVRYVLNVNNPLAFQKLANDINNNKDITSVILQHEFGLFDKSENDLNLFLKTLKKPIAVVFHTVLPLPHEQLKSKVRLISQAVESVIVMTKTSANILSNDYGLHKDKIIVIEHGTHLVNHAEKEQLKKKYLLSGRMILSTFGLLGSGKSLETTLEALPAIIKKFPDILFLIIGKTHPSIIKHEGEIYRNMLEQKISDLQIEHHVQFINVFLPLQQLLEYLQLTDIYLFTSKDPNQAVSGTFSYAISCGCPIISTPIPHAKEVLSGDNGIIFDFGNVDQLTQAVLRLLNDEDARYKIGLNGLHRMAGTAWENSAIAHGKVLQKMGKGKLNLQYSLPEINLYHINDMTTTFGIIQFAKINHPDILSGYTLDDNARALIALCQHYELTKNENDLKLIKIYLDFLQFCQLPDGNFLNYVDENYQFTDQNNETNLEDANGRAIWSLGYIISLSNSIPSELIEKASYIFKRAIVNVQNIHSTRAMAFIIKGLYYSNVNNEFASDMGIVRELADRMVQMYAHESDDTWLWFESYMTYGNSILPEAMLCSWLVTGDNKYKNIAKLTFDFLLSKTFINSKLKIISNKTWLQKEDVYDSNAVPGGEQPIDVAYTIMALEKFSNIFKYEGYQRKMNIAFNWFLGDNHLDQIIYNPCTGGCYDGLEEHNVNLNQGAESTVSYLMSRLTMENKSVHTIQY